MPDEVGSGQVAIVPTFKGFRREVVSETEDAARAAARTVPDQFDSAGREAGREASKGFRRTFSEGIDNAKAIFRGSFAGSFLGNIGADIGYGIGRAISTGVRAGVDFVGASIDIASSLNESINAVKVSYGDLAGEILKIGSTSARTFGVASVDVNKYAVQFGAFVKNIAGAGGDVAGTFETLLGRASDFASVMNLDVNEALALFQSGLAGETEPLRRFGVDLSAAAVEAYAYANGIAAVGVPLTEAQKQQARYAYLLEQTAAVQGDFINTQDEFANAQRTQAALWTEMQGKLGEAFLPVATALTLVMRDQLIPAIADLVEKHGPGIARAFADAIPVFQAMAEDILPKLPGLFENIAIILPAIIDGFSQAVTAGVEFSNWLRDLNGFMDGFGAKLSLGQEQIYGFVGGVDSALGGFDAKMTEGRLQVESFFGVVGERFALGGQQISGFFTTWGQKFALGGSQIQSFIGTVGASFATGWAQISGFFGQVGARLALGGQQIASFAGTVGNGIGQVVAWFGGLPGRIGGALASFVGSVASGVNQAISWLSSLPGRAAAAIGDLGGMLVAKGRALIQGFINGITSMIGSVGKAVSNAVNFAKGFFPGSPAKRGPLSGSGWTKIKRSGGALMTQWVSGMTRPDLTDAVTNVLNGMTVKGATGSAGGVGALAGEAPVQFVYNGDWYSFDPRDVAKQDREQLGRLLDANLLGRG